MSTVLDTRSFLRWCWRQLTSMRTALILLLLLAVAAIPSNNNKISAVLILVN